MGILFLIGVALVIYLVSRGGSSSSAIPPAQNVNQQWVDFIAAYRQLAKSKGEKAMVERMLADLLAQGMPAPSTPSQPSDLASDTSATVQAEAGAADAQTAPPTQSSVAAQYVAASNVPVMQKNSEKLDNTTLLLYFGAFLFLASAGLFVALSGAYGLLRAVTVLIVMEALYAGGFWLHDNKPKLRSAGRTFIGMGLMLAPLAGLALYSYVMRDQPQLVWLLTSLLCLGLYGHALRRLRTTFMEYIFIGTFLSLFESAVSVLQMPVYYYGWGFAVVGLVLHAWYMTHPSTAQADATEHADDTPAALSAGVLLPLSAMTALYLVPQHGVAQLGVSLLLAAFYYALQAWQSDEPESRKNNTMVAQVSTLAAIASFSYAPRHSLADAGLALLIAGVLQLGFMLMRQTSDTLRAGANGMVASLFVAVLLVWSKPGLLIATTLGLAVSGVALWLHQKRSDMYGVGMVSVLVLPYILGLYAVESHWHAAQIATAAFVAAAAPLASFFLTRQSPNDTADWRDAWRLVQVLALLAGVVVTIFSGETQLLLASFGVAVVSFALSRYDAPNTGWVQLSSVLLAVPLLFTIPNKTVWLVSVALAFLWNLFLTLTVRVEVARWVGSLAWGLLPLSIAHQFASLNRPEWYALSYFAIAVGFVLARAIAKNRISRMSITVSELEKRLKTDSQSYVLGYMLTAFTSYVVSLFAVQWLPAAIGMALAGMFAYIAVKVEREPAFMVLIPLLLQAALWGTYRTDLSVTAYVLLSSGVAALTYEAVSLLRPTRFDYGRYAQSAAGVMLYIAPSSVVYFDQIWAMPLTLTVAGIYTLRSVWLHKQGERELAGGVIVLATLWFMYYHGVTNIQAYTHVIAAAFGLYAYWRGRRGDMASSNQYLQAMLVTATIPLGLQVIAGNAGGLYGWWFLGEQIAIMLVGMVLRNRFVTRWGLYVAVGSVLFQLRALAWLSLTLLALFLIALAVYQLQKSDDKPPR